MVVVDYVDKGGVVMYNELKNEKVIIDLETLIKNSTELDEDTTAYALFMKERILSVSGVN